MPLRRKTCTSTGRSRLEGVAAPARAESRLAAASVIEPPRTERREIELAGPALPCSSFFISVLLVESVPLETVHGRRETQAVEQGRRVEAARIVVDEVLQQQFLARRERAAEGVRVHALR